MLSLIVKLTMMNDDEWVAVLLNSDFFCIDFFFFFLQTKIKSKIL